MVRWLFALVLIGLASVAQAQPEPRVLSRENIPATAGKKIDIFGRLAFASDGTGYALIASKDRSTNVVELIRFDRSGKVGGRHAVATVPGEYFSLATTLLHVLPSGEILIATSDRDIAGVRGLGGLLRVSPDGKVLHRVALRYPHDVPAQDREYGYGLSTVITTTDNAIVLGGSYGPGPSGWWWGKFSATGVRLSERTATTYFPMTVDALQALPDGGFAMVLRNFNEPASTSDAVLQRHAASGERRSHVMLLPKSESHSAAFTSDGRIVLMERRETYRLLYFNANGQRLKEVPWPTSKDTAYGRLITDGVGLLVIDDGGSFDSAELSRLDREGAVLWKTPKVKYLDVVSRGDEVVALTLDANGETATIVRLANP